MKVYVVDTPFGLFALNNTGKVIDKYIFGPDPSIASSMLKEIESGGFPAPISEFFERLNKKRYKPLAVDNEALSKAAKADLGVKLERPSAVADRFREQLIPVLIDLKIVKDETEYNQFVRQTTLQMARTGVTVSSAKRDQHAIQTSRALDDLDKSLNLFAGRIREWYGLHFPEMDRLIEGHDTYVRLLADLGERNNFTDESLEKEGLPKEKARILAEAARKSMGAEMGDDDLEWMRVFCNQILDLFKLRDRAEKHLEDLMKDVAPNMSFLMGSTLSAKLISIAGSLNRLAMMPSSTLQVLGAEKALFRALKTGARPPKHGIIFQYAPIHQAPRWQRGKIARALSGKVSIAARIDAFKGEFRGEALKKELEKRIDEIKRRYSNPPLRTKHGASRR